VVEEECNDGGTVVDTGRLEKGKEFSSKTTSLDM
jgi:hypothetical protein